MTIIIRYEGMLSKHTSTEVCDEAQYSEVQSVPKSLRTEEFYCFPHTEKKTFPKYLTHYHQNSGVCRHLKPLCCSY